MNELITERLKEYTLKTAAEEQNALKEIAQEIILYALSKTAFFENAHFCGGTALRIVHGLNRFSEDLDFTTRTVMKDFLFDDYLDDVLSTLKDYGLDMNVKKSQVDRFVMLSFPSNQRLKQIVIKLEIDANPPEGAVETAVNLDFPILHQIKVGSMDTLFAGKLHALLCRDHVKGRDWYDLLWYLKKNVPVNYELLQHALFQMGPYQGDSKLQVDHAFVTSELKKKIRSLNWDTVTNDVARFVKQEELSSLKLWSSDFFVERVGKLNPG